MMLRELISTSVGLGLIDPESDRWFPIGCRAPIISRLSRGFVCGWSSRFCCSSRLLDCSRRRSHRTRRINRGSGPTRRRGLYVGSRSFHRAPVLITSSTQEFVSTVCSVGFVYFKAVEAQHPRRISSKNDYPQVLRRCQRERQIPVVI